MDAQQKHEVELLCRQWGISQRMHGNPGGLGFGNIHSEPGLACPNLYQEVEHVARCIARLNGSGVKLKQQMYDVAKAIYVDELKIVGALPVLRCVRKTVENRLNHLHQYVFDHHTLAWPTMVEMAKSMRLTG